MHTLSENAGTILKCTASMGADTSTLLLHNEMFPYLHFKLPVKYVFNECSKLYASFHTTRHKLKTDNIQQRHHIHLLDRKWYIKLILLYLNNEPRSNVGSKIIIRHICPSRNDGGIPQLAAGFVIF